MLPEVASTITPPVGGRAPVPLRLADHGERRAVLDAATRVAELDLAVHGGSQTRGHAVEPDQRRFADGIQDGFVDGHAPIVPHDPARMYELAKSTSSTLVCSRVGRGPAPYAAGVSTPPPDWTSWRDRIAVDAYDERWRAMAAAGRDPHGEVGPS